MPTYEYECKKGHRFEVQQKITEEPIKKCQVAGCTAPVLRLISKTSFVLKGHGWAKNGYGEDKK